MSKAGATAEVRGGDHWCSGIWGEELGVIKGAQVKWPGSAGDRADPILSARKGFEQEMTEPSVVTLLFVFSVADTNI